MQTKRLLTILSICLSVLVVGLIFSSLNTALASIQKDLSASLFELQWIMNIFGLMLCSTLVIIGRLADTFGRKRLFIIGILGLGIAMLGAGLSRSAGYIIFFQAIIGLSSAIILPVSQVLISQVFPKEKQSQAIGIWATNVGLALAAGPLLSGLITSTLGWRWLYLINLPFLIICLLLVIFYIQESKSNLSGSKIDWLGGLLLIFTISSFVLAIIQAEIWSDMVITSLYIFSFIMLVLLLYVEKKSSAPIIQEDFFKNKQFLSASLANFGIVFFVWAAFFLIPLYLQNILSFSTLKTGLLMLFITAPVALFSFFIGRLYKFFGPKLLICTGFAFMMISTWIQFNFQATTSLLVIIISMLCFGIGWGLSWGPTTTAALSAAKEEHAGAASGTFVTIQEIGGTVGLAIIGSIVRAKPDFLSGYHQGAIVLLGVCIACFVIALLLKKIK